jgi:hypothetical protein
LVDVLLYFGAHGGALGLVAATKRHTASFF